VTDPNRWSDAGDGVTPIEQSLVRAGQDLLMPTDLKDAVWSRIVGSIPSLPQEPGPLDRLGTASKGASVTAPVALRVLGLAVAVLSAGAIGGYLALGSTQATPVGSTTPAATTTSAPGSVLIAPPSNDPLPAESEAAPSWPAPTPSAGHAAGPLRSSQLREESQAVLAARQALRNNEPAAALRLLDQARQRFGNGALNEEREVLTIEALASSGDKGRAAERAKTFLRTRPRSPHAADVQRHVAP
jgi:hypothetical protein